MSLIYQLFLFLGFLFYFPVLLFRRKKGPSLKERFGMGLNIRKTKGKLVWIHAVSLGETKAAAPLARMIKDEYGDGVEFVVSSGTATGRKGAEKEIPFASYFLYLPLDFRWIMRKLAGRAKPDLVIVSETDLWLNFLSECKKRGAKLSLVNGKMSERSFHRYSALRFWAEKIFGLFDLIGVQSEHYEHRFSKLGMEKKKLAITGNLKLGAGGEEDKDLSGFKRSLGLGGEDLILVIGSTHDPEERWFLEVLDGMWDDFPRLKVLLVPRHPERFGGVEELLKESGQPYELYSRREGKEFKIMLVDAMGILKNCYRIADAALVGGSFVAHVGGHNILEPAEYGVPVVFGPYMQTQPELEELCLSYGAGLQARMQQLSETLRTLLSNEEKREILGQNGLRLIRDNRGAAKRTFKKIQSLSCL